MTVYRRFQIEKTLASHPGIVTQIKYVNAFRAGGKPPLRTEAEETALGLQVSIDHYDCGDILLVTLNWRVAGSLSEIDKKRHT